MIQCVTDDNRLRIPQRVWSRKPDVLMP